VSEVDFQAPKHIAALGVPESMVIDIVLRRALLDGHTSTMQLATALAVTPLLMESAVEHLRHEQMVEVTGLEGRNLKLGLTDRGREQAADRMRFCRYAGAVPVSLADYSYVVEAQHRQPKIHHDTIRKAFTDLVISDRLLDELGPAILTKGAIFLYGAPGTGKSSIAERLIRVHEDQVVVPRAVEVDGQIIMVFDPVLHQPVEEQPKGLDPRWVVCKRPSVIVGGELRASQLDLSYDEGAGIYQAPLQMQANNGLLVIDDFGRQALTPEELLNRWIVPLDRGIDYLTLDNGLKFELPCLTKIVFSTNMEPSTLADEAFFRRIRSKVLIPSIDDEQFDQILTAVAKASGVTIGAGAAEHLRAVSRAKGDGDLRPYLPAVVCELVSSISDYEDMPRVLDVNMVDRVAYLFFTQSDAMRAPAAPEVV
jgi:predicted ATPase with chaperone activity